MPAHIAPPQSPRQTIPAGRWVPGFCGSLLPAFSQFRLRISSRDDMAHCASASLTSAGSLPLISSRSVRSQRRLMYST